MTANELRQSFLDFFREKKHTIVPSSSLMPASPNLQFTNAGMNQFVPYFLGTDPVPFDPPRAADTQKCIRAGGKHNDLEDVGYDTYHHTFFEMLGNWSFGDYFKKEAIQWAWELVVERWGFPANRLYATVYQPREGDPSVFDQEAYDEWAAIFRKAGLDPAVHIVFGGVKDNFWAMGDTGPCGPCSELHVDLTEKGDTLGRLVNAGDSRCMEIWNLVFIQFNRDEDGAYRALPAQHVDTGMGFERACSIMQCSKGFRDFSRPASNYDTDVFAPLFAALAKLCGKTYRGTVPAKRSGLSEQEQTDVAFRVIADHVRTVSFAIADGILPGNNGRNSTVKAILRRAVRFGRELGLGGEEPFLPKLVPVLVEHMGEAFPELRERQNKILKEIEADEVQFNKTLDRGLRMFAQEAGKLGSARQFPAEMVVKLWETFGFPLELTRVLLQERELTTDDRKVADLVQAHRDTGALGLTSEVVSAVEIRTDAVSEFVGYEADEVEAEVLEVVRQGEEVVAIVDRSPLYVEKGGQVGDMGTLSIGGEEIAVLRSSSAGAALCLHLERAPKQAGGRALIRVAAGRRRDIEKHHTATHILHWALHEVVDPEAGQQGSLVAPDRLRFDFNSQALTGDQLSRLEVLVNEKIAAGDPVTWMEVPHDGIRDRRDIMQFFGDKYGDLVRVVQIGGQAGGLNGWSMELCGGTHVRSTAEVELCAIKSEGAIAAGIRRIEAVCGDAARRYLRERAEELQREIRELEGEVRGLGEELGETVADSVSFPEWDFEGVQAARMADVAMALSDWRKVRDRLKETLVESRKQLRKRQAKAKAAQADAMLGELVRVAETGGGAFPAIVENLGEGDAALLQEVLNGLKKRQFGGVAVFTTVEEDKVHLVISVAKELTGRVNAGELMKEWAPLVGGRGGGKADLARGAGEGADKVGLLLEAAKVKLEALRGS